MQTIGLWQIAGTSLTRVAPSQIDLEKSLENWIEGDPSLVQTDLVIVARQVTTAAGRLDLLGIDPQGRWTVIEIKRGEVSRDTVAQALDYAAVVAQLSETELRDLVARYLSSRKVSLDALLEERDARESLDPVQREVALIVVGTGRSSGLERMSTFLASRFSVPLSTVSFDVFKLSDGSLVLARDVAESGKVTESTERRPRITPSEVVELAKNSGTGREFEQLFDAATRHRLYPRTWKTSIMYTSPEYRSQMLFTVWAKPEAESLKLWLSHETFAEMYSTTVEEVAQHLGADGRRHMYAADVQAFITGLDKLFAAINERSSPSNA